MITSAEGFLAAGVAAGIKPAGDLDVALVVGAPGTVGAAVFTVNHAAAAPVQVSRGHLQTGPSIRAAVLNSGCANAGTGGAGLEVATASAAMVSELVGCDPTEVIVCSTGPIGPPLDGRLMRAGIGAAHGALQANEGASSNAAAAILTTDTVRKEAVSSRDGFVVAGMAKGAGMIRPDMATMLAVLTTDAIVDPSDLDIALRVAVDESFHALNVDGCASTNDTVVVLASGASGHTATAGDLAGPLGDVCRSLAHQIAEDAEGATRVVRLVVRGAADAAEARDVGRLVADSALVRASFYGGDPNWGRILGALGTWVRPIDPASVAITYDNTPVAVGGVGVPCDVEALAARLGSGDFSVDITIGSGPGSSEVLTTDLTPDYVVFNGERS